MKLGVLAVESGHDHLVLSECCIQVLLVLHHSVYFLLQEGILLLHISVLV